MLRTVQTKSGIIEGLPAADPRITSFKGIPFAKPPVGNLRWHAPVPVEKWDGVLKAWNYGPISVQPTPYYNPDDLYCREWSVDKDIPMSEDCLYLNVWTPANKADEKLPVYVWIYGGGFQTGFTAEMEFDGERIARRGIVVVTLAYRLNMFGFMCHPDITAENPDAPANFGLLDQRMAMKWVKDNIEAFGGDAENITLGGQSAGGGSVMNQIMYGQENNLFKRAVCHSGMFLMPGNNIMTPFSLKDGEEKGKDFFKFLGVSTLEEARNFSTEELRQKWSEYGGFEKSIQTWVPVCDEKFIKYEMFDAFEKNVVTKVPMMFGHTTDEFSFVPPGMDPATAKINAIESALHKYQELAENNSSSENPAPENYFYVFDVDIPGWDNPGKFHSVDLWFWFETLAKCWRPFVGKHYDIARHMCNYLCNYIKTGNPNGKDSDGSDLPLWKPFTVKDFDKRIFII